MKVFWNILFTFGAVAMLRAQTNSIPPPKPRAPTQIFSDKVEMDVKDRSAIYSGNVRVEDPQMKMTCELLTARMITNSTKIESIVAERNVVIDGIDNKGETSHGTADKLVYTFKIMNGVTNETIELTGKPQLTNTMGGFVGDPIKWDITSGRITALGHETRINSKTNAIAPVLEKVTGEKK
jgi:lipopolysaccharide transport protein LptA